MKIKRPGRYKTREGRIAIINRIDLDGIAPRAYGKVPGSYDRTWWYAKDGEHALCLIDDLISMLDDINLAIR